MARQRLKPRGALALAVSLAWLALMAACNAILGNDEITYVARDSGADGAVEGSIVGADGETINDGGSLFDAALKACDASFCSDFDPPLHLPPYGWSALTAGVGMSAFGTDSVDFTTSPFALVVRGKGGEAPRVLQYDVTGTLPMTWSFDVRMRSVDDAGPVSAVSVFSLSCGGGSFVRVRVDMNGRIRLVWDVSQASGAKIFFDSWARVNVVVSSTSGLVTVEGQSEVASIGKSCPGPYRVELGLATIPPASGGLSQWEVLFDHVTATITQ